MAGSDRWYFSKEKLYDSPSRRCGIDAEKELSYRQQAANFIQDMGQRLQVTQLCINTAIVYMHRFYIFHSFSKFHRNAIAACAIFLAAKVEEQPRKLEHVIKVAHFCLNMKPVRNPVNLDVRSPEYTRQANELVVNENIMLQTLGFDIAIEHPHTSVVKCCQLVRASKDLAQTSYFMATNSLHLTTMCLQYRPTVVACVCIHLACKWASWEIPVSNEGKDWFYYVDNTVTLETLETLTEEFLAILDKCPSRLRRKMLAGNSSMPTKESTNRLSNASSTEEKKNVDSRHSSKPFDPSQPSTSGGSGALKDPSALNKMHKKEANTTSSSISSVHNAGSNMHDKKDNSSYAAYKEKKELERKQQHHHQPSSHSSMPHLKSQHNEIEQKYTPKDSRLVAGEMHTKQSTTGTSKQQQLSQEKQRLNEERSKLRTKSSDQLWIDPKSGTNSNSSNTLPVTNNGNAHAKSGGISGNNFANQAFYDNLLNEHAGSMYTNSNSNSSGESGLSKHFKTDSLMSGENEDSSEPRSKLSVGGHELKMEFSDNESNQSPTMTLSSISSLMMPEGTNGYADNGSTSKSVKPKNSFMNIFTNEEPLKNSMAPMRKDPLGPAYEMKNSNQIVDLNSLNSMLDFKTQQPPKMLSPLGDTEHLLNKQKLTKQFKQELAPRAKSPSKSTSRHMPNMSTPIASKLISQSSTSSVQSHPQQTISNHIIGKSKLIDSKTPPKSTSKSPRNKSPIVAGLQDLQGSKMVPEQMLQHLQTQYSTFAQQPSLTSMLNTPATQTSIPATSTGSSSTIASSGNQQASLLLDQLPPPVALDFPPLPTTYPYDSTLNINHYNQSKPAQPMQPLMTLHSSIQIPQTEVSAPLGSLSTTSGFMQSNANLHMQPLLDATANSAVTENDYVAPGRTEEREKSKSKSKDKEREKHHKSHKEKKHKHKSKDRHKDKHREKDKDYKYMSVSKSEGDEQSNNSNTPIRLKMILKKPEEGGEGSKELTIIIPKASLGGSSDRKRRTSPKESRNAAKMAKIDD